MSEHYEMSENQTPCKILLFFLDVKRKKYLMSAAEFLKCLYWRMNLVPPFRQQMNLGACESMRLKGH